MKLIARAFAACALVSLAPLAQAIPTAGWSMTDTHAYGKLVTFDNVGRIANNTLVTNQFQAAGLTFSGTVRANGCGYGAWNYYGMQNNYLNTFGPDCVANTLNDSFAIKFDQTLSKLAMDAFHTDNSQIATLDLYLKGKLVTSFSMPTLAYEGLGKDSTTLRDGRYFTNTAVDRTGILQIGGARFDEIRFTENWDRNHYGYLFFDNLRFDAAPADVPEPAGLGLFALGLAGLGALRRRRAA